MISRQAFVLPEACKRRAGILVLAAALAGIAVLCGPGPAHAEDALSAAMRLFGKDQVPAGFYRTNGRLESEQVEIATKIPGRIAEVLVKEGDVVEAGQVLVRMDVTDLNAQLRGAEAQVRRAEQSKLLAEAVVAQRESEKQLANQELQRVVALREKGFSTAQILDQRRSTTAVAEAALAAAKASVSDAEAAIEASRADVAKINATLDDMILKAPRHGRVQYRLAQPGEVLGAGSRVLTLVDLTDVYMTVFVPASVAAQLGFGDDARLILDPIPQYVVPAKVTFVASEAQFTPKTVETRDEREKLMFRVKLTLPAELLRKYETRVKTGVRGLAFLPAEISARWPASLAVKLPQ
jgi:HlyD family secretion protein